MSSDTIEVHLTLTCDRPNSMNFADTCAGLDDIWYRVEVDPKGNVELKANADGFEHLATYFLKMARCQKKAGYHAHQWVEFGKMEGPEFTITVVDKYE